MIPQNKSSDLLESQDPNRKTDPGQIQNSENLNLTDESLAEDVSLDRADGFEKDLTEEADEIENEDSDDD
jgi:hypothetical protein